jgi:carbamoyl-phosphate synthase large subunit
MTKIPVLITGVAGGVIGRQCMKALELAQTDYKIITCDINPNSLGLYLADNSYIVPKVTDGKYLETIFRLCEKEGIKVVIPGSEPELEKLCEYQEEFKNKGILLLANDPKVIKTCQDKWLTNDFLKENSFKYPKSYIPKDKDDVDQLPFPVIIKPTSGGSGSKGVFIAQNPDELTFFIEYLKKQGMDSIIQEYVGSADEEYTVGVLHSLDGEHLGTFVLKRIVKLGLSTKSSVKDYNNDEVYIISSGVSQGIVDDFPDVAEFALKVAESLKSRGPLNIQCRKTDQGIFLFEINPRFSGTTSIRALCNYNEPDLLIRKHLLNQEVGEIKIKKGLVLRDLENYYVSPVQQEELINRTI